MFANTQMISLCLDGRIDNLVVKELRRLWLASNPPVVVVDEAPQERELATLIQNLDPDEIAELARECLDALVKLCNLGLDLGPQ
jgi:hypothetical protein